MSGPLMNVYAQAPERFVRGEGAHLFTADDRRYLDFIAGIAVNALGHAHPRLTAALTEQAGRLWHLSNMFEIPGQRELAARYCDLTFAEEVFFTNSGAEAIECALKAARRYHFAAGRPERVNIITFEGAFHGRTYGAVNAGGNPAHLEGFGPRLPGFVQLPFGDHDALHAAVDETTAAVLVEPIQGEGGVRALPEVCLTGLRALTKERGALLIYDEVQCGAGRTGKLFAHEWAKDAAPDLMAIAKGMGGGFPMGACLATSEAARGMTPGAHGTTYGGNALAMAVGAAALDELTGPELMDAVRDVANELRQGLVGLMQRHPRRVVDVRGKGLLLGLQLAAGVPNRAVRDAARARGLLVGLAGRDVVRIAPPLIITSDQVREALAVLEDAVAEVDAGEAA